LKKNILYIYPQLSSFIKVDKEILSEKYNVIENTYNWRKKYFTPLYLVHQFFYLLSTISNVDTVLISFGGYWSLLPTLLSKLFNKKSFIIVHGTDATAFKEINYGSLLNPILKIFIKKSYENAYKILPVSEALIYSENTYYDNTKIIKQGIKHFFPTLKTPMQVIHNGIDTNFWKNLTLERNPKRILAVFSNRQFYLKGGDLIIQLAIDFPDYEFLIAGSDKTPENISKIPNNVKLLGYQHPNNLLKLYNTSTYYFQLSIFEGFGYSLCEAMSCGCIPIVSNVNFLPAIIEQSGYILKHRDYKELKKLFGNVEKNKVNNKILSETAQNRIKDTFDVSIRKKKLLNTLKN
jgi:glycosyltransferase involved in cell wall biosynthesis